ncbi:MAG TPA: hypothetical protein DFR83_23995, partial [Deltaproteobacteria bacterium]|nr:hypothetical protein [Deltaproteobacteria bacterium]
MTVFIGVSEVERYAGLIAATGVAGRAVVHLEHERSAGLQGDRGVVGQAVARTARCPGAHHGGLIEAGAAEAGVAGALVALVERGGDSLS